MNAQPYPQSVEAERALLGCCILEPTWLDELDGAVKAEDFYRPDHAALFDQLRAMRLAGRAIDMVTVPEVVLRKGADRFGGIAYVLDLPNAAPSTINAQHYAEVISQKSRLRRMIQLAQTIQAACYSHDAPADELQQMALSGFGGIDASASGSDWATLAECCDEAVANADAAASGERTSYIPTPWNSLNEILGGVGRPTGIPKRLVTVLAARPSMGKSSAMRNIAEHSAANGEPVAMFLAETPTAQLGAIALAGDTSIPAASIRSGQLTDAEWGKIADPDIRSRRLDITVNRRAGFDALYIRRQCRALNADRAGRGLPPIGLVCVDYLQLMKLEDGTRKNKTDLIGDIMRELTMIAADLDVAVLLLSQLNRDLEKRQDKRPQMSDLRDSGSIEQDARCIIFVYRDVVYNPEADPQAAEFDVAKNTLGSLGTAHLRFDGPRTTFFDGLDLRTRDTYEAGRDAFDAIASQAETVIGDWADWDGPPANPTDDDDPQPQRDADVLPFRGAP